MKRIYITYDNIKKQDGVGAQLQRIFGIYSISQKFRLGYIHSPIINTAEELAHNISSESELNDLLNQVNSTYVFPSSKRIEFDEVIYIHNITSKILAIIFMKSVLQRRRFLLKVCLPFGIMDKHPDWYEYSGSYMRSKRSNKENYAQKKIVVHVRYGYKPIKGKNVASAPRFLPLSYYPQALKNLLKRENLSIDSKILIHTDIPNWSGQWKPFQESKLSELSAIGYEVNEDVLSFEGIDLKSRYFSDFTNVEVKYCAPLLETLDDLIAADVLLMSRSSFSYVAGIINSKSVYMPRLHGHSKLKRWQWDFSKRDLPFIELLSGI